MYFTQTRHVSNSSHGHSPPPSVCPLALLVSLLPRAPGRSSLAGAVLTHVCQEGLLGWRAAFHLISIYRWN